MKQITDSALSLVNSNYLNLLMQAHDTIRSTRTSLYFANWDRFTDFWLASLEVEPEIRFHSGANLGTSIDQVFESALSKNVVEDIICHFKSVTSADGANKFLATFHTDSVMSLIQAAQIEYSWFTLQGFANLKAKHHLVAMQWLAVWQASVEAQNYEQATHREMELLADQLVPTNGRDFARCTHAYIQQFQHTSTLLITFLAAFPFSPKVDLSLLTVGVELVRLMMPLYRLISDIMVDENEILNCGIYAYSCEQAISLIYSHNLLHINKAIFEDIKSRLLDVAFPYHENIRQQSIFMIDKCPQDVQNTLYAISKALLEHGQKFLSSCRNC